MNYPCGICNANTSGTKCLLCRKCETWFHVDCENVSRTLFNMLDKNRNIAYTCTNCVENPPTSSDDAFKTEMREQFASLRDSFRSLAVDMKKDQTEMKEAFEQIVAEIRTEFSRGLQEVRQDVEGCREFVTSNDVANKNRFLELELQNHSLQHRLNRSDIVVTGLPESLENLKDIIVYICAFLKVDIVAGDVDNVMYIKNRRSILIKFKNIAMRDAIMAAYYKSRSLKMSDIIGGSVETRVYLNDNLSNLANKVLRICMKLKKENKIASYNVINREVLKVRIALPNQESKVLNLKECVDLFKTNQLFI